MKITANGHHSHLNIKNFITLDSVIEDCKVICDETNNSKNNINNGMVNVDIYFKTKSSASYINLDIGDILNERS